MDWQCGEAGYLYFLMLETVIDQIRPYKLRKRKAVYFEAATTIQDSFSVLLKALPEAGRPAYLMTSRQRTAPVEDPQRVLEDEEAVSGPGEGDEIMDEVEEQEDGYSEPLERLSSNLSTISILASSTPTSTLTWISWFCSLPGHEYFCEVTEDFIEDDFNLTGLNTMVPFWKEAMEMVLDVEPGVGFWFLRLTDISLI